MTQVAKIIPAPADEHRAPASLALQVELAARTVPPLWPLDGAIAVNPLAGLEEMRFDQALRRAATLFDAEPWLPLAQWRRLSKAGRPGTERLRQVAIEKLGGLEHAFHWAGPNITLIDCLMARLLHVDVAAPTRRTHDPSARTVAEWCAAYFAGEGAGIAMPGREKGLYAATTALIGHLPAFRGARATLADLPAQPLPAIAWALERLKVSEDARAEILAHAVARLPGWAGHIRWRGEHADADVAAEAPAAMAELIALILICDVCLGQPKTIRRTRQALAVREALAAHFGIEPESFQPALRPVLEMDEIGLSLLFQEAAERGLGNPLAQEIAASAASPGVGPERVGAQLVFCIDVRSEPMRRAIEAEGAFETLGYAGFFGLPIAVREPGRRRTRQLPVLVAPQNDLALAPVPGAEDAATAYRAAQHRSTSARTLFDRLKGGAASAFTTAEAVGPLAGLWMAARTFAPRLTNRLAADAGGDRHALAPALDAHQGCGGLSAEEKIAYARAIFALTGMEIRSRLVVLVGHAGQAVNNPYKAALDCGACAGHGGAPNARALAAILNEAATREALGLPEDCHFLAGEHNTTTDTVRLFDLHLVPDCHAADIAALQAALDRAGRAARTKRAERLDRPAEDLATGAAHWGEVRPEWGLAGNAVFIVGPRTLTRAIDLEGRAFLHDYDWRTDASGEALATILTAPMVVAQWINCQYLFSTLDNDRFGAGDKTVHNPVGGFGVLRGNGGDLAVGLPRQSLFHDDGTPAHVPQRLTTIVHAPLDRVAETIEGHAVLRRLFGNGWVRLIAIDPETGKIRRWQDDTELEACGADFTSSENQQGNANVRN